MYVFLENNSFYVVLLINLIIWVGIFGYIFSINKKVNSLLKEKQ
jgi:CcmD family protein